MDQIHRSDNVADITRASLGLLNLSAINVNLDSVLADHAAKEAFWRSVSKVT